ncbi:chemotaxis protein [Geomonas silvestris]|uniref:Chemotaxis protein n=1 Tax=Geomonas silvestris TaxID=2740184 RepID=A0A6V8MEJ3_9BACT|nr:methyl-accepting chemotaxis protein [Geomonas silvestris]GFO58397.1 chemotaxis protein [Geomonas silvestris]
MGKMGFGAKVLCLVLFSSIGTALVVSAIALTQYNTSYKGFMESYRQSLFADFDSQAKSQVQSAISMLQKVADMEQRNELTPEAARKVGADLLRGMKYGESGYFWADTTEGVNVVLLGKPVEGTNRLNTKDAKGKYLIQEIIKQGVAGGGFTDYWFPKAGETEPQPKRGYSQLFKPFGWVVGTGNYVDDLSRKVQKAALVHEELHQRQVYLMIAAVLAMLVVTSLGSVLVARRLLRQIGTEPAELARIAEEVAQGNLSHRFEAERGGIYGAMRQMVEQLRQVMHQVNEGSQAISVSAVQLNGNAHQMANSTDAIVGQANTAATASEEMAATSLDIASNCHLAAQNSDLASQTAQEGAHIVQNTVEGMERIAERVQHSAAVVEQLGVRSDQIGSIVATIEDIADQTNLLALNAAIEAARAGEQGRGFAVVADEVRALADRTTKATHEISQMIRSIQAETRQAVQAMEQGVQEVHSGTLEAARSGNALEEIQRRIVEVTQQINQIATAAEEQSATTREISDSLQQISGTVQLGVQNSREIEGAAAALTGLSGDLEGLVRRFRG